MNLGKPLAGAALGAAIGLGAHAGLEYSTGIEAFWFPVLTGLITGLGARVFDPSVAERASYVRGALAAALGLAGIVGGVWTSAQLHLADAEELTNPALAAAADPRTPDTPPDEDAPNAAEAEQAAGVGTAPAPTPGVVVMDPNAMAPPEGFELWSFVMIGLGVFLAYELARGGRAGDAADEESGDGGRGDADGAGSSNPPSTEADIPTPQPQETAGA